MKERSSIAPAKPADTTPGKQGSPVTLAALLARFGAVPRGALVARFAQAPVHTLVMDGQRFTTARLVREAPAVIGGAVSIVEQLLPEQRDLLVPLDDDLFAAAVTAVDVCRQKGESRGGAVRSAEQAKQSHRAARQAAVKRTKAQRAVVYAAATTLAGADPARKAKLDAAWGKGDDPDHLAASLGELVAILREQVAEARAKKVPTKITSAWIDRQAAVAAELSDAAERAGGHVAQGEVAQGDVAWWRGVALWFLRRMADVIDAAHEADPRVARLALGGLRTVVRRPRTAKKKTDAAKGGAEKTDAVKGDAPKPA